MIDDIDIDHYRTLKADGDIRKAVFDNQRSVVINTITRVGRNKPKLLIKLKDANMAYELVQRWKETTFTKSKAQINPKSSANNNTIGIARGIPLDATDERTYEDLGIYSRVLRPLAWCHIVVPIEQLRLFYRPDRISNFMQLFFPSFSIVHAGV